MPEKKWLAFFEAMDTIVNNDGAVMDKKKEVEDKAKEHGFENVLEEFWSWGGE